MIGPQNGSLKLSTSCVHVDAAPDTHCCWNAVSLLQDADKLVDAVGLRRLTAITGCWVKRNDIDVAQHPLQKTAQRMGLERRVILALDEGPFKRHTAVSAVDVFLHCIHQIDQRIAPIDRQQCRPLIVGRSM